MTRRVVGPFNRVEGDLEVHLEIHDGAVQAAWVNSPLFRGFERILAGKDPRDSLVYTPRICGICSVSQSMAAAYALADAQGLEMPYNGALALNLILANENVADHFTHFYLFFMPDFARAVYAEEPWHGAVVRRFKAVSGTAAADAVPARAKFLHLMGFLAGKWPHSLAIQPGGTSRPVQAQEKVRLLAMLSEFRRFLEARTLGIDLERLVAMTSLEQLLAWAHEDSAESSDLRLFLHLAEALKLERLGRGPDRFMSYGAYTLAGQATWPAGVWKKALQSLDTSRIAEDISHSWAGGPVEPVHPYAGVTSPDADKDGAYSWCKAPRLGGETVEVGALARQMVAGHPLVRDLVSQSGGNVRNRVIARLLEVARVVLAMEGWVRELQPGEVFCRHAEVPDEAVGVGLVEAARGSLGHWLSIRGGNIANYQIIAPTTWNFSPRDGSGTPGPLEQALAGTPVREGEKDPVAVQHVVRSFDPCMVCTVH